MHIGLIGGIGPAATTIYYERLVGAFRRAQVPLSLTISHADIEVLAKHAVADDRDSQAHVFAKHLVCLEGAGCDISLITALTGHFCFRQTSVLSPIRLLDGVGVIDRFCQNQDIKILGLLGSPPVMSTHLFRMLNEVKTVVPHDGLEQLGQAYMSVARSGVCNEEQRSLFFDAASEMVCKQHAEAILLAGTDLGLVFRDHALPFQVIDAVDLHVQALLDAATSE